jgi:hypothetical protein
MIHISVSRNVLVLAAGGFRSNPPLARRAEGRLNARADTFMEHHSQRQNIVIPGSTQGLGQPTKKKKPRFNLLLPLTPPGKKQRSQGKAWLIYFSASGTKRLAGLQSFRCICTAVPGARLSPGTTVRRWERLVSELLGGVMDGHSPHHLPSRTRSVVRIRAIRWRERGGGDWMRNLETT